MLFTFSLSYRYRESAWERENIIVMDVKIYPPYRSENCLGQEEDTRQLQQIRKMVNHMFLLLFPIHF